MPTQDRLRRLADELAAYIKNGDNGLVLVSEEAIKEVIMLLRMASNLDKKD